MATDAAIVAKAPNKKAFAVMMKLVRLLIWFSADTAKDSTVVGSTFTFSVNHSPPCQRMLEVQATVLVIKWFCLKAFKNCLWLIAVTHL